MYKCNTSRFIERVLDMTTMSGKVRNILYICFDIYQYMIQHIYRYFNKPIRSSHYIMGIYDANGHL